eukprot:TRINITY_DN31258_c0_g1_i2.p1 TRINITY_DN31258_c0_g1~~TRINITY_DN31258_c0_g1_i2.p1  ORF type:complete len:439 (-),score=51.69 TRINITY_DN31258_c0_g1_i2:1017-2333(-)
MPYVPLVYEGSRPASASTRSSPTTPKKAAATGPLPTAVFPSTAVPTLEQRLAQQKTNHVQCDLVLLPKQRGDRVRSACGRELDDCSPRQKPGLRRAASAGKLVGSPASSQRRFERSQRLLSPKGHATSRKGFSRSYSDSFPDLRKQRPHPPALSADFDGQGHVSGESLARQTSPSDGMLSRRGFALTQLLTPTEALRPRQKSGKCGSSAPSTPSSCKGAISLGEAAGESSPKRAHSAVSSPSGDQALPAATTRTCLACKAATDVSPPASAASLKPLLPSFPKAALDEKRKRACAFLRALAPTACDDPLAGDVKGAPQNSYSSRLTKDIMALVDDVIFAAELQHDPDEIEPEKPAAKRRSSVLRGKHPRAPDGQADFGNESSGESDLSTASEGQALNHRQAEGPIFRSTRSTVLATHTKLLTGGAVALFDSCAEKAAGC